MELANKSGGATVISASSYDGIHHPQSVIDGDGRSYWMSTGIFPQEIVLHLEVPSVIKTVDVFSTGVKTIELSKSDGPNPNQWETICTKESEDGDNGIQRISMPVSNRNTAVFLRIKVYSGWTDFITIHKLSVKGTKS